MEKPQIDKSAKVFEGCTLMGDVQVGPGCSIWPGAVLRGDVGSIYIGENTNIQDGSICHTDGAGTPGGVLRIGANVTVGHLCILHGCTIGAGSLIGMGSIVMSGAKIGENCLIGAGSLVTEGAEIPSGWLAFGRPAKPIRPLSEEEKQGNLKLAQKHVGLIQAYE